MDVPPRKTLIQAATGGIAAGVFGWALARTQASVEVHEAERLAAWLAIILGLVFIARWKHEEMALGSTLLGGGVSFLVTRKMATQHLRALRDTPLRT